MLLCVISCGALHAIRNNGFGETDREKAAMFMPEKEPCSSLDISTGVVLKYLSLIGGQIILGK